MTSGTKSSVLPRAVAASLAFVVAVSTVVVAVVGGAAPASALQPAQDRVVSDDPADFTPHVLDGEVKAIAVVGNTVVLGGSFTSARDNFGGPVLTRRNILAFDRTTGLIDEDFAPVVDDTVRALVPAPDGQSVFVGGQFGAIDGVPTFKVARLNIATGQKLAGFNPGVVNAVVYDMKLVGNRLLIAGQFTAVAGQPRSLLAELDPTSGAIRPTTWPTFAGTHNGGVTHLEKIDVNPDGQTLVAIGNFTTVGALPRVQVVMLTATGTPTVVGWRTTQYEPLCIDSFTQYVTDVEFSPDGAYFVIATTGGWGGQPKLCDTVTRWDADRRGEALKAVWADYSGGDSNYAVAVTGTAIYVGGHERWWNNPNGNNEPGPGAVSREGIAALDPLSGLPFSWNPTRERGRGVFDMVATADGLWVGSDTEHIGDFEFHARVAFFPLAGGTVIPAPVPPPLPVDAYVLGGATPVAHGMFDGEDPGAVVAGSIDGFDPATATGGFWLNGKLFLASTDGTLTVRSYDGDHTGPATTIDLHGLTGFADELTRMTGLFYTNGSIVYTLKNDSRMYRRLFTPESGVVGATRYNLATGGIDWKLAKGMFLADGDLYWSAGKKLHRVEFAARGPKPGTDTIVSSPALDGRNWSGTAMFTLPPPAPNEPPVAAFDVSCVGAVCDFDATDSLDPDGEIVDYAWDFGDGELGTGAQVEHEYDGPGTYDVTLTVTDDETATGSQTGQATVVASAVAFVGSARHQSDATMTSQSVTLPAGIETGDQLVLTMSFNAGSAVTVSDPAGWVRADEQVQTAMSTVVWTQAAPPGAAGSTVSVTTTGLVRSSLLVSAYRNATVPVGGVALAGETVSRTAHTTPVVDAPEGSWVLSSWADKTSATTTWTPPDDEVVRQTGAPPNTARIAWLLTDNGGPVAAGSVGGKTAVADSATNNATMMTVVLAPA